MHARQLVLVRGMTLATQAHPIFKQNKRDSFLRKVCLYSLSDELNDKKTIFLYDACIKHLSHTLYIVLFYLYEMQTHLNPEIKTVRSLF